MKNTKRKVLVGALAVSLVAIISVGSLAWFSDSDEAKNKFMVASSKDQDPDDTFSVDVWEYVPEEIGEDPVPRDGHTYEDVMPADNLKKETYIENTGKYDQYVRMIVKVSDAGALAASLRKDPNDFTYTDILLGFQDANFKYDTEYETVYDEDADTFTFVFYGKEILKPGDNLCLFESVKIPETMTQDDANQFTLRDGDQQTSFLIDVKGQAVQTKNLGEGDTVAEKAKSAFETVGMELND